MHIFFPNRGVWSQAMIVYFVVLQEYIFHGGYTLYALHTIIIIIQLELSNREVANKRAGGHVFDIFSLNWGKLPFPAESSTTFNLLFLVRMIVNWNGLSGAGEQNQIEKYTTKKTTNTKTKQLIQSKYTVLNIVCVPAVDQVVWKMTRIYLSCELQCE